MKLRSLFLAMVLSGTIAEPVLAATSSQDENIKALLQAATLWDGKDRPDLARDFLQKALLIKPDAPQVLSMLGEIALRSGRNAEALGYLQQLEKVAPNSPFLADLRNSYRLATYDKDTVARMRLLARAGQIDEAGQLLKQLYPNGPPHGEAALEYYSIIGSAPRNAAQAANALGQLYRETGDVRYRLGQLNILANNYDNRHAAIKGYEELARAPSINTRRLQEAWRLNLYRLPNDARTVAAIRRYLSVFPDDQAMVTQIASVQRNAEEEHRVAAAGGSAVVSDLASTDPNIVARGRALEALNKGDLDAAEAQLQRLLRVRADDPQILGGLGMIRFKRGDHAAADEWFVRANRATPGGSREWREMIVTTRFAQNMRAADQLLEQQRLLEAEAMVRNALSLRPNDVDALALLANIRLADGDNKEAESLFRDALKREPDNGRAMRGLVSLLARSDHREEAHALLDAFAQRFPKQENKYAGVRADLLREEADTYLAAGRPSHAIQSLEAAIVLQPADPWHRFTLAKVYDSLNLPALARRVMEEGVQLAPKDPGMRYANALNLISQGDNKAALQELATIVEKDRTQGMKDTEVRAGLNLAVEDARLALGRDLPEEAREIMAQAERIATNQPGMTAIEQVAEAWFSFDQPERGLALMKSRLKPSSPVENQLYYASLLNRAGKDEELQAFMPQLDDVVAQQSKADPLAPNVLRLREIRNALQDRDLVRMTDAGMIGDARRRVAQRAEGEQNDSSLRTLARQWLIVRKPDQAIILLKELKARHPNDTEVRSDLTIAYYDAREMRLARQEAAEVLSMTRADDFSSRLEVARLLIRIDDYATANRMLADLAERFPDQPEVRFLQGRAARGARNYAEAIQYLKVSENLAVKTLEEKKPAEKAASGPLLNLLPAEAPRHSEAVSSGQDRPWLKMASSLGEAGTTSDLPVLRSSGNPVRDQARAEILEIEARRQPRIEVGLDLLTKSSSDGTSTFRGREIPMVAWMPVGYDGHAFLHVDQVDINAGSLPANFYDASLFGTVDLTQTDLPASVRQRASGTSVGVGYQGDEWRYDIGVIGMGFPVSNVVGGVQRRWSVEGVDYTIGVSRRPQVSSLLSYAGAVDPVTGKTWGGVTDTAVTASLSTRIADHYVFASASYGQLRGRNTKDNDRLSVRTGFDRDLYRNKDLIVNSGVTLSYLQYDNNQSFYTFGHGGYYSPQESTSVSVPLQINGREERLSYMVRASVSYSHTKEDDALLYPNDPDLQQAAQNSALFPAYYGSAIHPGGNGGGFGYSFRAVSEYRLTPHLTMGGRVDVDRSAYYTPSSLLLYLRYHFKPQTGQVSLWPDTVTPYSRY
ncbi:cellulose synthase subunit BcsC-related outer membrane protein [uncultured Oxalicibacterium sp.]|uniref:cellulose synthase subunit BcsC-related outer membrane protein n=1 Tax=uncultured Oxalicibacterium sp. TaxID=1168540 RepID=UPI0025EA545F|nr:cellulose synthase subunit BcsC-related outer membrane protein [uncultured Oxalicibacterium sp.]